MMVEALGGEKRHDDVIEAAHGRMRTRRRFGVAAVAALFGTSLLAAALPARAQVSTQDRGCITTFNKSMRKVAKTHGKIVKKCLVDYASGRLTSTAEECIAADPGGKLAKTINSESAKITSKCSAGLPGFGVSTIGAAMINAVLAQYDLVHGSIGADLNTSLLGSSDDASCQAKVGATLLSCQDARINEYLKCQKKGLKDGVITDATTLADTCLGTGNNPQPDAKGRIALKCDTKLAQTTSSQCSDTDLLQAFPLCGTASAATLSDCLSGEAACQLCRLLNAAGGLVRDCDAFDDGNGLNGSCSAECGDSILQPGEGCDDGDQSGGDGCAGFCQVEGGWTCTGEPSVCTLNCGNGDLDVGEACDDGNLGAGDGCSSTCTVESGYSCSGEPSVCTLNCGNGAIQGSEVCDDGDHDSGDGCSSACVVEPGYQCGGQPSVCTFVCGNSVFNPGETCDDGDASGGDGCSAICQIEPGWLCAGVPSVCTTICGDGLKKGAEGCDDDNILSGDGCSFACQVETGYTCAGVPSVCSAVCGDGFIRGLENCDDSNATSGDGCSGTLCRQETDYACAGQPSVCQPTCGDGNFDGIEACDDGNNTAGDGCSANCAIETGYACYGTPSLCQPTCGDTDLDPGEQCDDGNVVNGDGCTASCVNESGWLCTTPGSPCQKFDIFIDSPAHGVFTTAGTQVISGHYTVLPSGSANVKINGVNASTFNSVARTFSHTVNVSQAQVFNPVLAELTYTPTGDKVRDRIVVIGGQSVADPGFSPQSVAMRLNDSGLDSVEPLVSQLAAGMFDLGTLLPPGTVVTSGCFIDSFLGCLGSATVTVASPAPSFSNFALAIDSITNAVKGDITIFNLRVDVNINGSGLVPSCGLRLTANSMLLSGNYALEPDSVDASNVDVNLVTNPIGVSFAGFQHQFTSGLCDAPIIGDIINSLLPDVQDLMVGGIQGFLSDPDGGGPGDSPIADAIESVLAGISIAGPVGEGVGLQLSTPLFEVAEDSVGITFGSDSRFTVSVGSGPGQCIPPPGAPNLTRSYAKAEAFPSFSATTPVGHAPYGLGICISSAGFNQLLRGQTECGLMITSLTDIDIDGSGPLPPVAVTSTLLSALIPQFGQLPANTPLRLDIQPTLAPVVTGNAGPNGELTELKVAHILMKVVQQSNNVVWLTGAVDVRLGMNLAFDGSGLNITVNAPNLTTNPNDLTITLITNPLGADQNQVNAVLPGVVAPLIPSLAGALSGFPLPELFGLNLQGVEVSHNGQFLSLFANLVPTP